MSKIVYLPIKTPEKYYIYDRSVDTVFSVSEDEFQEFVGLLTSKDYDQSEVIKKYQQRGLLRENNVDIICHPATDAIAHYLDSCLSSLVLQVTQQCNLRCWYCAYSGLYHNRVHNASRMSFETAKRAIDFYLSRTGEKNRVYFGFYGGEPLLEFDLIKKCVEYVKKSVEGKEALFGLTTNGTLLTDEKIDFFYENNFSLIISLDGSKEEHDSCRKFPNGEGSFDIVTRNIDRIRKLHPDYVRKVGISTVISPQAELNNVLEYFDTDEVFADTSIIMSPMVSSGLKEEIDFKESFHLVRRYELLKFLLFLIGKIDRECVSKLMIRSQRTYQDLYRSLKQHTVQPHCTHHGGPCLPGIQKLFVDTSGNFYPCEKVSESTSATQIGSLDKGFDIENIKRILNIGKLTENECKDCWALPHCNICVKELDSTEGQACYEKRDKINACQNSKGSIASELYQMCVLHEFGYRLDEEEIIL